jgi:hypothetical protein
LSACHRAAAKRAGWGLDCHAAERNRAAWLLAERFPEQTGRCRSEYASIEQLRGTMELFRYDNAGATLVAHPDRLEMTAGLLWKKQTHVVSLRAVTGLSVHGVEGHTLRVETAGRAYELPVGVGVAGSIRDELLKILPR